MTKWDLTLINGIFYAATRIMVSLGIGNILAIKKPFSGSGCEDFPVRSKCFGLKLFLVSM